MSSRTLFWRASALALGVAMLSARPVAAQRAGSFEFSAFGGGYWGNQLYQGPTCTSCIPAGGVGTVSVNSAGEYGLRAGMNFQRGFGVEFSWSASDPSLSFSAAFPQGSKGDVGVNNFDFDAMFNFGQQRIWGYFALGIGWADYNISASFPAFGVNPANSYSSSKSYFSGNTALGLKAFINPHLAFQIDTRYRWTNTGHTTSSGVGCYYYCYGYSSTYYGAFELSGGLTYVAFK